MATQPAARRLQSAAGVGLALKTHHSTVYNQQHKIRTKDKAKDTTMRPRSRPRARE